MGRCWNIIPEARPPMQEVLRELWGDICKEEFDHWSRQRSLSVSGNDGGGSSNMDIDAPREAPAQGMSAILLATEPVGDNLQPGFGIAEEPRYDMSEKAYLAARKILESLEVDSKITWVIRSYIEAAAEIGSTLLALSQRIDRSKGMADSVEFKALRLVGLLQQLKEESIACRGETLAACIVDIQRELRYIQDNITGWCSSGLFSSAFSSCDELEGSKTCEGVMRKMLEEIRFLFAINSTDLVTKPGSTGMRKERRRLLDRLGDGNYGVKGNAIEDITCLPGTRVNILEHIDNWVRGTSSSERALWIRGMAGRGKSTIASTVARRWKFRAPCAIFHYRRGQDTLNSRLVCALARQLGTCLVSEVKNTILESIGENEDIANEQLSQQFKTLLVAALGKLNERPYPILLIVDALDECHDAKDVVDFIKLIHRHSLSFPANVKFLLTCRPEAAILRALEPNGWNELDLDSAPEVSHDLARFIHHACTQIRNDHKLPEGWPSDGDISRLVDISQGLFQWACTAITYISNGSPIDRLNDLLRRQVRWGGLDDLYHQILSKAMYNTRQEPEKRQLLCSVLGTIAVAPHPVSLEVIATLYNDIDIFEGMKQDSIAQFLRQDVLIDLNSLLHIPNSASESVRFMHTSIRDLLISRERCQEMPYYVDATRYHWQLASLSLGLMLRLLKENICGLSVLSQAGPEIQKAAEHKVSKALRYCCQAWSVHLTEGLRWSDFKGYDGKSQLDDFTTFSQEKVLAWLEVMSIIGAISEGSTMAKQVHSWLVMCPSEIFESLPLVNLWNDIHRFIAAFLEPISFGPLHIYASALPHCPRRTELWRFYSSSAKVGILGGHQMSTWPSNLWTRAIDGRPQHIAFSKDGSFVITGLTEGKVQFWESETGRQASEMPSDRIGSPYCVCVSPDGRILASGSDSDIIRLWDTETAKQLGEWRTGDYIVSVRFSPDGRVLASKSAHGTIQLWDIETGKQLGKWRAGYHIPSVCFSPDGRALASGGMYGTIRLWDTQTGRQLGEPLIGHSGTVLCVCFSPDGRILASGSSDKTIRLWDTQTGRQLGEPLTGHRDAVRCVCFSPDGRILASGSSDKTIRLWDTQTGRQLAEPLTGHRDAVWCVCFSPGDRVLASGSWDMTIRLWDTQTGRQVAEPLTGNSHTAPCARFSPDGRVLASGSWDMTIRLWDTQTGRQLGEPLTGHDSAIWCVSFSPDGRVLASGSWDYTIRLWDTQTGRQLGEPLTGHGSGVWCVCFSPDGRILVSGSADKTIRLWDTQTGRQLGEPLPGNSHTIPHVCFSPDGRVLAFSTQHRTVRLWDTETGRQLGELLTGHSSILLCICFSPDGKVLASGSWDMTIRLWDTQTGRQLGEPLTGDSTGVRSVSFSPDGVFLVGHLYSGDCHIWDVRTLQKCHHLPRILSHSAIGFQDHWITHYSQRLLWLPTEYWGTNTGRILLYDKRLAVAHGQSVSVFDLSRLPWSLDGML